ncbi:MAG TPA: LiaF domain-containing protein [Polyangiaceae bacterium]|nr:LiaF domain-containing protein [Polyangiaceae bacterium]
MRGDQHPKRAALRQSRARTIERLTNGFTRDELALEEFEERLNRAYAADAEPDLDTLVADLSPETEAIVFDAEVVPAANVALVPSSPSPRALAILGSVERRGQLAARASGALAVLGSVVIDLRDVSLPAGVSTLQVSAVLGSVEIIVPPTLAVESAGASILGSFEGIQRVPRDPDPDLPVLRVQGRAVLGSIEIRTAVSAGRAPRAALPPRRAP